MQKLFVTIIILLITSCSNENPKVIRINDSVHGVVFEHEHISGPALSPARDWVYAVKDGRRQLIFEGYGAPKLMVRSFENGLVVIEYCNGWIDKVDAFNGSRTLSEVQVTVKIQPVVIPDVIVNGIKMCSTAR
jgi:hypothetical protein